MNEYFCGSQEDDRLRSWDHGETENSFSPSLPSQPFCPEFPPIALCKTLRGHFCFRAHRGRVSMKSKILRRAPAALVRLREKAASI
jgi:hypothetical protein